MFALFSEEGAVFVWGYGLLGCGPQVQRSIEPIQIPETLFGKNLFVENSKVVKVACGLFHLAAINNYGHLYMWGRNKSGCLGLGHIKDQNFPLKVNNFYFIRKRATFNPLLNFTFPLVSILRYIDGQQKQHNLTFELLTFELLIFTFL